MTREEAHTLLEVMAIELTGELADSECPVTKTKLLGKQLKAIDMAIEALQDRPTGKWVSKSNYPFADVYYCSNCSELAEVNLYGKWILSDYCPNCGADMIGGGT